LLRLPAPQKMTYFIVSLSISNQVYSRPSKA
jgi:hypothetical protein